MKNLWMALLTSCLLQQAGAQFSVAYTGSGKFVSRSDHAKGRLVQIPSYSPVDETIRTKCRLAAATMEKTSLVYPFLCELWKTDVVDAMRTDLYSIADRKAGAGAVFASLFNAISNMKCPYDTSSEWLPDRYKATISSINRENEMLLDLYNKSINDQANAAVKNMDWLTYARYCIVLERSRKILLSSIIAAQNNMSETNRNAMINANSFRDQSLFKKIRQLLGGNWFQQWLWYTQGEVRLHPFVAVDAGFGERHPQFDMAIYDDFSAHTSARISKDDAKAESDAFGKLLIEQRNNRLDYFFQRRSEAILADENIKKKLAEVTAVKTRLNTTLIPLDNKGKIASYLYYSADQSFSGFTGDASQTGDITNLSSKTIVIYNIPAGKKSMLNESTEVLVDAPPIKEATAGITPLGSDAADLLKKLSASVESVYSGLQGTTKPVPYSIDYGKVYNFGLSGGSKLLSESSLPAKKTPAQIAEASLRDKDLLYDSLFLAVTARANKGDDANAIEAAYLKLYTTIYEQELEYAYHNLRMMGYYYSAIVQSIPPPAEIKPISNEEGYTTEILHTKTYPDAVINNVAVVLSDDKGTVTLSSFKYKMGKRYRFQLTAALAYSFLSPVSNTASVSDGKLAFAQEKQELNVLLGLNVQLGAGLFLRDTRVAFRNRFSVFAGAALKEPLNNLYAGLAWDIIPSVKLMAGSHFHARTDYKFLNNQIAGEQKKYQPFPFIALGVDPVSLVGVLNLFK